MMMMMMVVVVVQVNWNVFSFVISQPRQMIKATATTVRGQQLITSINRFAHNLSLSCNKLTSKMESDLERWTNDSLLEFTAQTMFDAIFNTVFGRDDSAVFNSNLAYNNFQVRYSLHVR